jgi:hypothetical protein
LPAAILTALAIAGCMLVHEPPTVLPVQNAIVFDQLVVYSNFALPKHHRMLDDLRSLRGQVIERLNLEPSNEPIHVYLFESEERFNKFLAEHHPDFPARRAFFIESDNRLAVYAQWGDRVAEDLRHEVTHGYLHSAVHDIPLWLDEGIAEYFEVPYSDAGLNRPHARLLLTRSTRDGWRPSIERLERLQSAGDMKQEDYAEAWAWVHWMLNTDPAKRELLHNYLVTLKKYGSAEPLSLTVRQVSTNPELDLVTHLQTLGPVLQAQK